MVSIALTPIRTRKITTIALSMLTVIALLAVLAPILPLARPTEQNLSEYLLPPSRHHWFGTDDLGRDIFSRTVWGARLSLIAGTVPVLLALAVGLILGLLAAYYGGVLEQVIMRLTDFLLSIPYFLIALIVVSVLGPGLVNAMVAIAIGLLPSFMRLSRASALVARGAPYVLAAHSMGMVAGRIMFIHILPNIVSPLVVFSAIKVGESILAAAALSFLGLGAQPPTPEWGLMLTNARELVLSAPHAVIFPSIALSATVLAFNLLADELRDQLDPRYRY
ncbi:MAG TPA: ABC transporter permease [bacterium]